MVGVGLLTGKHLHPMHPPFAAISLLDGGVEDTNGGAPDVGAGAVALDEGDNRVVGDTQRATLIADAIAFRGDSCELVRCHADEVADSENAGELPRGPSKLGSMDWSGKPSATMASGICLVSTS